MRFHEPNMDCRARPGRTGRMPKKTALFFRGQTFPGSTVHPPHPHPTAAIQFTELQCTAAVHPDRVGTLLNPTPPNLIQLWLQNKCSIQDPVAHLCTCTTASWPHPKHLQFVLSHILHVVGAVVHTIGGSPFIGMLLHHGDGISKTIMVEVEAVASGSHQVPASVRCVYVCDYAGRTVACVLSCRGQYTKAPLHVCSKLIFPGSNACAAQG